MYEIVLEFFKNSQGSMLRQYVIKGVSGTFAMRILSILFSIATTFLLARVLTTGGYGSYAYALAWANLLYIPAMLGFDKLLVRETAISIQHDNWGVLRGIIRWTNVSCVLISIAVGCSLVVITELIATDANRDKVSAIAVASVLIPVMSLTGLRRATLRGLGHVVIGQVPETIIRPILLIISIIAIAILVPDKINTRTALIANVFAASVAFIVGSFLLVSRVPSSVKTARPIFQARNWVKSAFPLLFLGVLQIANAQISTLILGIFHPAEVVGQYAIAVQVSSIGSFFLLSFNAVLAPMIARLYSINELNRLQRLVTRSSWFMCLLTLPAVLCFVFFGKTILGLFGSDYAGGYTALVILSAGVLFSSTMGSVGLLLTMTHNERYAARIIGWLFLTNIALSFFLVPKFGTVGAASAATTYLILSNILLGVFVFRRTKIVPSIFGNPAIQ